MTSIYQFRSMDNLIHKYSELEDQELVLSSPRYLNDPLEGYQDVFWKGDEVLWENLLRNYLLNLLWAAYNSAIFDYETLDEITQQPILAPDDLPTDEFRQLFDSVCQSFFDKRGFGGISSSLASLPKPLKRKGLQFVLSEIQNSALSSIFETLRNSENIPDMWPEVTNSTDPDTVIERLDILSAAMADGAEAEWLESIASHFGPLKSHAFLQRVLQTGVEELELQNKKAIFLSESFPGRYVKEICDSLIHTNWHTLSFAKECTSPSMWSAYADEHRGAALMFHTDSQSDGSWSKLDVEGRIGWQGSEPRYGQISAPLYAVEYESPPPEVDFFRFLGTLPRPKLMSAWHSSPGGETSPMVDEILRDVDAWRENLWDHFHSKTTTKLEQWKHEQEIRMVLPDLSGSDDSIRKVNYDSSQLAGVIFGLRTKLEDRYEVMRILHEGTEDGQSPPVEFYEMVFDGTNFKKVKLSV